MPIKYFILTLLMLPLLTACGTHDQAVSEKNSPSAVDDTSASLNLLIRGGSLVEAPGLSPDGELARVKICSYCDSEDPICINASGAEGDYDDDLFPEFCAGACAEAGYGNCDHHTIEPL